MNKEQKNQQVNVFICDDSSLVRALLRDLLESDSDINVVGEAENGKQAVEQVLKLKPDLVTMDLEMPVMGGHEAIQQIMSTYAIPILVVSSLDDAQNAYKAISNGALDVIGKPQLDELEMEAFTKKVKMLAKIKVIKHINLNLNKKIFQMQQSPQPPQKPIQQHPLQQDGNSPLEKFNPEDNRELPQAMPIDSKMPIARKMPIANKKLNSHIVAIVSSTGGPQALEVILSALPADFPCPIVVSQHMSKGFSQGLADWLDDYVEIKVKLASNGEVLKPGIVYISPSQKNLSVTKDFYVSLCEIADNTIYHPNCDVLLKSVALAYANKSVAIICTGMSRDGASGMESIHGAGGVTIAQDEASSVIFGMNKEAISRHCIKHILSVDNIAPKIVSLCQSNV